MTCPIPFEVNAIDRSTGARRGVLSLARGEVQTPVFMPVGTQAAVRTLAPHYLDDVGASIVLCNTYHLHQRPGEDIVQRHGGLHRFMGVDRPILTDSGGFQVFSLDKKQVSEDGVTFAYEVDGKRTFLSPETAMDIQQKLGSDIAMAFDECLHPEATREETERSVELTARWEARSVAAHTRSDQSLFGIVQGGMFPDLRRRSAGQITGLPFDGYAIGGLSVGEGPERMNALLAETTPLLPADLPRYLMGVGRPQDLVDGVALGVDMFDCVIPTRHARSGTVYTFQGRLRLTHGRYRKDTYGIDTSCGCYTCSTFTRAYLHHLLAVGEVLASTLCTIHNLTFFSQLMARVRDAITDGTFQALRRSIKDLYPEKGGAPLPTEAREARRNAGKAFADRPRGPKAAHGEAGADKKAAKGSGRKERGRRRRRKP